MKLNVPMSRPTGGDGKDEGKTEASTSAPADPADPAVKVVVGYALTEKKRRSFLQPKFISVAGSKGIEFVPFDLDKPLSEQGPFNIILHKLEGKEWSEAVERVKPEVLVLDPPQAIQRLRNRQLMLEVVSDLKLPDCYGPISIPKQVVISSDPSSIPDEVTKAGLKMPLVVKPLIVDASARSHDLSLAYDLMSLSKLDTPVVLQEFINHDAVLFKIFVIGESIKVIKRSSLPNVIDAGLSKISGIVPFQRVSCAAASAENVNKNPFADAQLPPEPLVEALARELRQQLGLQLFNIDVMRKTGSNDYYIIDINYFPGYAKMPDYEHMFSDFLLHVAQRNLKD